MKSKSQVVKSKNTKQRESFNTSLTQVAKTQNEFEDVLMDIDITKPRTAFNFYIKEMREKNNLKGNITDAARLYAKKYQNLTILIQN